MIDANTLVASTSSVSSDDEYDDFVQNALPPFVSPFVALLSKHLGDDLRVSVADPYFGATLRLQGEGLVQILRTVVKYAPSE